MAEFQHAAARRRLDSGGTFKGDQFGFNTQPPEGGWICSRIWQIAINGFNTQPPEGGWAEVERIEADQSVSTHSRLKAAGRGNRPLLRWLSVSTHSRLKAAGAGAFLGLTWLMFQHTAA